MEEYETLRAEFIGSFAAALVCIVITAADLHLMWIGQVGGHYLIAPLVGLISGFIAFATTRDAWVRQQHLKQLRKIVDQAPYGKRMRNVPPNDAVRDIGGGMPGGGSDDGRPRLG